MITELLEGATVVIVCLAISDSKPTLIGFQPQHRDGMALAKLTNHVHFASSRG